MNDPETLALFQAEAESLVDSLEQRLLALQDTPDDQELVAGAFRDLHTLKGSSSMFGRADIATFLHEFETAFENVRGGRLPANAKLIEICLGACDHVAALLSGQVPDTGEPLVHKLRELLAGALPSGSVSPQTDSPLQEQRPAATMPNTPPAPRGDWHLAFRLSTDTLRLGGKPETVLSELRKLAARDLQPITKDLPPLEAMDPTSLYLGWQMTLPSTVSEDDINGCFMFHEDGLELNLVRENDASEIAEALPAQPHSAPDTLRTQSDATGSTEIHQAAATRTKGQPAPLMRVPASKLDEMMDRVGELVIAEARLFEVAARLGDSNLFSVVEDIQRMTTAMRDTTMSIRMVPIGDITGRFRRLVHDLTGSLEKPIVFRSNGEDTELDKTVVERLTEPLMHLIRNSADHGLEDTETRIAMGKPPSGTITLAARYSGAEVLISLSDDGRGLSREKIRKRAEDRGLIKPGADLTDEEIFSQIFEPGFSTAEAVTELSGRGVGMDVVRRTIEGLRGNIEVSSEPGHGTTMTLRLPLTLAIIDGLLIEVAEEKFVIPLAAVDEIVELPARFSLETNQNAFLDIRDSLVPFVRLRHLLESKNAAPEHQKVIIVTSNDQRVGLVVDRIIGAHQTVIKQLSPLHAGLKTFAGATILGDGSVALILDVTQLVAKGRGSGERGRSAA